MNNEVKKRFHMQLNEADRFKIMDYAACPEFCFALEDKLHDAILENHANSVNSAN